MDSVQIFRDQVSHSPKISSLPTIFSALNTMVTGKMKLKCRIVPHSSKDELKNEIRSDSSTAHLLFDAPSYRWLLYIS